MESHNRAALKGVTHQRAVLLECSHVTRVCRQSGKAINRAGGGNSGLLVPGKFSVQEFSQFWQ